MHSSVSHRVAGLRRGLGWVGLALALGGLAPAASALELNPFRSVTTGSGRLAQEQRPLGSFSAVQLRTLAAVEIRQGEQDAVQVQADDNVLPLIDTHLDGSNLVVRDEQAYRSSLAKVVITVQRLRALSVSGSTVARAQGLEVGALSLSLGGSSALALHLASARSLSVSAGGSSALSVAGTAGDLSINLGGSAAVKASSLDARQVTVHAGGSSVATVWAREQLTASLGGSSALRYYGRPATTLSNAGSSVIRGLGDEPPPEASRPAGR